MEKWNLFQYKFIKFLPFNASIDYMNTQCWAKAEFNELPLFFINVVKSIIIESISYISIEKLTTMKLWAVFTNCSSLSQRVKCQFRMTVANHLSFSGYRSVIMSQFHWYSIIYIALYSFKVCCLKTEIVFNPAIKMSA